MNYLTTHTDVLSPLQDLDLPLFKEKGITVKVKRDDLIDDEVSGNKWRKLKYNIKAFREGNFNSILTFGGAYSNHILATAKVGNNLNIPTIGVIRGEETLPLNPTLKRATELGMKINYISRSDYRKKNEKTVLDKLKQLYPDSYIIPEGGANTMGVLGSCDIVKEISGYNFDYIFCDCGTGATLAGIAIELKHHQKAIGIPVLKGGDFILSEIEHYYHELNISDFNWEKITLFSNYHFGGYAKYTNELINFMRDFYQQTGIKTDPVYTSKLFYAFIDLIKNNTFKKGTSFVIVHTGGLQGIEGFEKRYKLKLY